MTSLLVLINETPAGLVIPCQSRPKISVCMNKSPFENCDSLSARFVIHTIHVDRKTRGRMAMIERKTKRYPTDLTDEEWERIESLLPAPSRRGRKPGVDLREVLNAIRS